MRADRSHLVVVGSLGRSGLWKLLIGSAANHSLIMAQFLVANVSPHQLVASTMTTLTPLQLLFSVPANAEH